MNHSRYGICKLCLREASLRDSHYIPKALYRHYRKDAGGDPIVMTRDLIVSTSKQVHDYVFCAECEHRLNIGGEGYLMKLVARRGNFPLRNMLDGQHHTPAGPFLQFSGTNIGLDVDKIAYYAISMVWRGSAHTWRSLAGQTTGSIVASHMEEMRRYLMGEIALSNDIYVFVLVCLDLVSQIQTLSPFPVDGVSIQRYEMLMSGIFFQVGLGCPADVISQVCCVHAQGHPIFAGDRRGETLKAVHSLHKNAKVAENVPIVGNVTSLIRGGNDRASQKPFNTGDSSQIAN